MDTFLEVMVPCLITLAGTIITCIFTNSKTRALMDHRITELEKKVEKHNSVIERTYQLEKQTEVQEEKIKVANNRIKDLEEGLKRA